MIYKQGMFGVTDTRETKKWDYVEGGGVGGEGKNTVAIPAFVPSLTKSIYKNSVKYCRTVRFSPEKNLRRNYFTLNCQQYFG